MLRMAPIALLEIHFDYLWYWVWLGQWVRAGPQDKLFLANTYIMAVPFALLDLINTIITHIISIINIILSFVTVGWFETIKGDCFILK